MDHPRSSRVRSRLESGCESCELVGEHGQSCEERSETSEAAGRAAPETAAQPDDRLSVPAVLRQLSILAEARTAVARPIAELDLPQIRHSFWG